MSCVRSPRSLLSPLPSFFPSTLIVAVWNAVRMNLSAGPLCLLTESNTIFYTGEHEHGLHRFWGENHRHDFNKGFDMFCSSLFFIFSCCLIRCTYAKKMNTSALFTINISILFRLSAERNRRLSFQHSWNREMIYRKSALTLQMLHFIWSVYQSLCWKKS